MKGSAVTTNLKQDRFSVYAIWQDIDRAIREDFEMNSALIPSYRSSISDWCLKWLARIGPAILKNDRKEIDVCLSSIARYSIEPIEMFNKGHMPGTKEETLKPYYEFNQAYYMLAILLDENPF